MADERLETARNLLLQAVESLTVPGASRTESLPATNAVQMTSQGTLSSRQGAPRERTASSRPQVSAHSTESVLSERNRLFNFGFRRDAGKRPRKPANQKSKKKKLSMWTHDFVCLASTIASKPPSSLETASLIRAGLGKKQLTLFEADDGCDVHAEILRAFPKLVDGGGYELMRVGESGQRALHVIPPLPDGYSVTYLKEVVRQAKVYIRPLQKDLTLDPEPFSVSAAVCIVIYMHVCTCLITFFPLQDCPSESCTVCGVEVPLPQLRDHLQSCKRSVEYLLRCKRSVA